MNFQSLHVIKKDVYQINFREKKILNNVFKMLF